MGGGASSMNMEDLIQTTVMVGRAIAAISFPGMYRIYDFHSAKAPRLKTARQFVLFSGDSEDEGDSNSPDPSDYAHFFKVDVNGESVYLEDVLFRNSQNWNALHTCCMSYVTVAAGLDIINEMARLGASFEDQTDLGPGTFNKRWTALHMASAYGIEPLVRALLNAGADANCTNSFGYTPLLEACHRGFMAIVDLLLKAPNGIRLDYIPSEEASESSPFVAAPSHSALGEASRCGFSSIVQRLIDASAPLDQKNSLGWTPLHEACFYNRTDVVRALLTAGASASIRNKMGALPYHLSGLQSIRSLLQELGGPGSIPEEGDVVDMMAVLHELTMGTVSNSSSFGGAGQLQFRFGLDDEEDNEDDEDDEEEERLLREELALLTAELQAQAHYGDDEEDGGEFADVRQIADCDSKGSEPASARKPKKKAGGAKETSELLHSGRLLGDLPSLQRSPPTGAGPSGRAGAALHEALQNPERLSPDFADSKKGKKGGGKKKGKRAADVPPDMPSEFLCQLSHQPMSDPVQTIYGSIFDRATITRWFQQQGHICPLTGAPLAESDLKPMDELGQRIRRWILNKSLGKGASEADAVTVASAVSSSEAKPATGAPGGAAKPSSDDLYDF